MYCQPRFLSTTAVKVSHIACCCLCGWMLVATAGGAQQRPAQQLAWDSNAGWTGVAASPAVREGSAGLSLRPYGSLIQRYDGFSQPAIGVFSEGSDFQSYPTSFWHDPDTDDIYITMLGGGGLTILSPDSQSSVTYRNRGIWDTSLDAVGQKVREDWQFSPMETNASYFDVKNPSFFSALRRRGTSDIWIAGIPFVLIMQKDHLTYVDDELKKDFWTLGFSYLIRELYEDDEGQLYMGGEHSEGTLVLLSDLKTLVRYDIEGATVIEGGTIAERFETPKIPVGPGRMRTLLKQSNGDLLVGNVVWDTVDPKSAKGGTGLTVLSDYDVA